MQENPQKYSMWWLRIHEGNLQFMGSTPAEQNHSIVAITVGNGVTLGMLLNVTMILERQTAQHTARTAKRNKLHMCSQRCKGIPGLNGFKKKLILSPNKFYHDTCMTCAFVCSVPLNLNRTLMIMR